MRASLSRLLAALALLTLGWLASGMAPSAAQAPGDAPVTRWEYTSKNVYLPDDDGLNLAGSDGWELVTVYLQAKHDYMAVFKRPKP